MADRMEQQEAEEAEAEDDMEVEDSKDGGEKAENLSEPSRKRAQNEDDNESRRKKKLKDNPVPEDAHDESLEERGSQWERKPEYEVPPPEPEEKAEETEVVKALRSVEIAEMYSPPRVTKESRKFGIQAGEAMDLSTGWDFRKQEDRDRAIRYIDNEKPELIIGSPMCTMFSVLQN